MASSPDLTDRPMRGLPNLETGSTVRRIEGQGVGQSAQLEYTVYRPGPAPETKLYAADARFAVEADDHAHAGGVDEFQPAEVELDPSQPGGFQRAFQRGLHRERCPHVEVAGRARR